MAKIDISTDEKKKEVYEIFDSLTSKNKIHEYFKISDNKQGSEYVKQIANEIGFDLNIYKERKKKYCLNCGKELKNGQYKFCSCSCSATYNNLLREFMSEETKKKISETLLKRNIKKEHKCEYCGNLIKDSKRRFCSVECKKLFYKVKDKKDLYKTKKEHKCEYCGKIFYGGYNRKFCSNECSSNFKKEQTVLKWIKGEYKINESNKIPMSIREFLLKKNNYKCELCDFEGYNVKTNNTILQIHHIDGNSNNNSQENLQILCPNCHAMTENYMALNKGKSGRIKRYNKESKLDEC